MAHPSLAPYYGKLKTNTKDRIMIWQSAAWVTVGHGKYSILSSNEIKFGGKVKIPLKEEKSFKIDIKVTGDNVGNINGTPCKFEVKGDELIIRYNKSKEKPETARLKYYKKGLDIKDTQINKETWIGV